MNEPPSLIMSFMRLNWVRRPWTRRGIVALALAICAVLTLFPQRYRAAVTLTPADPASLGLSAALGQLGALNTVFGNQAAVEVAMRVGRSVFVRDTVMNRLKLTERLGKNRIETSRWLDREISIRTLRGGILVIETTLPDRELGRQLVTAYSDALQNKLAEIARRQTAYKRKVLEDLVSEASDRRQRAQRAYDDYRLRTRYADPSAAMQAIGDRIPALEAAIKAKEVELNAARQFATEDNMSVRQIVAQLEALRLQLSQLKSVNPNAENTVGRVVRESTLGEKLSRELSIAQSLYDSYLRLLEGTSVEDLTSNATIRILENPYIDTARQLNFVPLALGLLIVLFALGAEFYQARPPIRSEAFAE